MRDYIKTQLGSTGDHGRPERRGNARRGGSRMKKSGGIAGQRADGSGKTYKSGHSSVAVLLEEIRQDAAQATGGGHRKNKRRHGSHEQVNGVTRPYAKRGKGGIGGNKYAGMNNKKKRRRR